MGNSFSYLEDEKETWINHTLSFDENVRSDNLPKLCHITNGTEIYLAHVVRVFGKLTYEHWFVTDGKYNVEFGLPSAHIYNAFVTINKNSVNYVPSRRNIPRCRRMDESIRDRIKHLLGMKNYSLCLRNSEHIANYIFNGRWISSQLDSEQRPLMRYFRSHMDANDIKLVNTFPFCMIPHMFTTESKKLYSFLDGYYKATGFEYYLDYGENTHNILVIGPTGSGKSHFINVIFNQPLCDSDVSHHSVTRDMYFIRGKGSIFDRREKKYIERDIVVADTIGLCDTEWDDDFILSLIKSRISSNFKKIDAVFIVFKADRLQKDQVLSIKAVLKWLQFRKNYLRIHFVCTFAENLSHEKKNELKRQAVTIFNLHDLLERKTYSGDSFSSMVYTGFLPEDALNSTTTKALHDSYEGLKNILTASSFLSNPIPFVRNPSLCHIL